MVGEEERGAGEGGWGSPDPAKALPEEVGGGAPEDDGGGVDPKLLPHILEDSFALIQDQRSDTKRNMGIGLSVCRSIIAAHGGTIRARNTARGAEFSITLPLYEEEESHV